MALHCLLGVAEADYVRWVGVAVAVVGTGAAAPAGIRRLWGRIKDVLRRAWLAAGRAFRQAWLRARGVLAPLAAMAAP
jgi:hypothetical protein